MGQISIILMLFNDKKKDFFFLFFACFLYQSSYLECTKCSSLATCGPRAGRRPGLVYTLFRMKKVQNLPSIQIFEDWTFLLKFKSI
jgi:hypothetical protein